MPLTWFMSGFLIGFATCAVMVVWEMRRKTFRGNGTRERL